jgi:hypothetical protein
LYPLIQDVNLFNATKYSHSITLTFPIHTTSQSCLLVEQLDVNHHIDLSCYLALFIVGMSVHFYSLLAEECFRAISSFNAFEPSAL